MSSAGDAAPATSPDTAPDKTREAAADDDALFARKGGAAPAPAKGDRPAIFLVDETTRDLLDEKAGSDDDAEPADGAPGAALFELDDDTATSAKAGDAPAASLDAEPFDPSRKRPLVLDDAADKTEIEDETDAEIDAPVVAAATAGRARLLTATLVGAAAIAAIAAVMTALNWYDFSQRPETETAKAPEAANAVPEAQPAADAMPAASPSEPAAPAPSPAGLAAAAPLPPTAPERRAPVIDLVRIEPGGGTLVAGRAEPGTALIVLDNDRPIGSVVAGAEGDWMLVPEIPLGSGEHEIALAVKAGDGAVSIAAPEPRLEAADATPTPRPAAGDLPSYVVQVASVKTADGAAQEWAKLQKALPDLLGDLTPSIDAAELRDRGTFHRIRLGPFADRQAAHDLCTALNDAGKDCLVVRR